MVFLGLDPGTSRIGFGLVKKDGKKLYYIDSGILDVSGNFPERLVKIEESLCDLINKSKPSFAAIETLIFAKNRKTAIEVAEARGVLIAALCKNGIPFDEFSPSAVKLSISGDGSAAKESVAKMAWLSLGVTPISKVDDATDALALAITGALRYASHLYLYKESSGGYTAPEV